MVLFLPKQQRLHMKEIWFLVMFLKLMNPTLGIEKKIRTSIFTFKTTLCVEKKIRKGQRQWQDHEDAIVIEAVTTCKEQPFTRWSDLAQKLPGRVRKQIRDRWLNILNPNINHMSFSEEDDI